MAIMADSPLAGASRAKLCLSQQIQQLPPVALVSTSNRKQQMIKRAAVVNQLQVEGLTEAVDPPEAPMRGGTMTVAPQRLSALP